MAKHTVRPWAQQRFMTEEKLRGILAEWIMGEFTITDWGELEDSTTSDGHLVRARDHCLQRYRTWLSRLVKSEPKVPHIEETFSNAIRALEALLPEDGLTLWEARSKTTRYRGLCSRQGMITFYEPEPLKAEPGTAPNGGPAAPSANSGVTEGPPSVS
jgi:hypothetical protein